MTNVTELQAREQAIERYGIVLGLLVGSPYFPTEIQRAPDTSGEPNTTAANTIATLPASLPRHYIDYQENDQQTRWYRGRHVKYTYTDSDWTDWVGAKPVAIRWYNLPMLPSYPRTDVTQEQPPKQPENVTIRLRGWPEHDDTVFRYAYLASTETVPLRSESTSVWTTYSTDGAFTIGRDASYARKLAAWGDLNDIWGPITVAEVGPDLRPQITGDPTWTETTGISIKSSYAAVTDLQTVMIDIYRRKANWPTLNSSSGGTLDVTYYKGQIDEGDNWSFEDYGWAASEVVYEMAVPLDWNANAGPRNSDTYTVSTSTGAGNPQITLAYVAETTPGTTCSTGNQRQLQATWDTINATSATHDMRVYYRVVGKLDWTLAGTESDPINNTSYSFYVPMYESTGTGYELLQADTRLDLWDGSTADDSALLNEPLIYFGIYCT